MSTDAKIVVAESYGPDAMADLERAGRVVRLPACDPDTLAAAIDDADALLVRTYARVTRELLDRAHRLRVIGRAGVGLDNIDLAAAHERGIVVVSTPAAATHSVAELTVGLMIGLERRLVWADTAVRQARFMEARAQASSRELHGLTLGIIGMGRIGQCVGRIGALGLGMRVIYNDIVDVGPLGFSAEPMDKPDLFRAADVVSLHVPLTPLTERLIDATALATMKPTATLINTSRGAVVDLDALAAALQRGAHAGTLRPGAHADAAEKGSPAGAFGRIAIAGAALDVYEPEPPPPDHPIFDVPNVLLSAHIGARTAAGIGRMERVVDDVIAVLQGRPPAYPALPD